ADWRTGRATDRILAGADAAELRWAGGPRGAGFTQSAGRGIPSGGHSLPRHHFGGARKRCRPQGGGWGEEAHTGGRGEGGGAALPAGGIAFGRTIDSGSLSAGSDRRERWQQQPHAERHTTGRSD